MAITAAQAEQTQRILALIESSRLRLQSIGRNLTTLAQAGQATCEELRAYNLWALSIYQENKAQLQIARANGATGLPLVPPTPVLFRYRGMPGEQALNFPCDKDPKTLSGMIADAVAAPAKGVFLPAEAVEVIPAGSPAPLDAGNAPKLTQIETQLGLAWGVIIIVGIAITATAAIVIAITSYLATQSITEKTVQVSDNNLKIFQSAADLRARCLSQCTDAGGDPATCVKQCANVIPVPQMTLTPPGTRPSGGLGFWGWLLAGTAAVIGGRYAYRRWQDRQLPPSV